MDMTSPTVKAWILIFVFVTANAVSSLVAGSYGTAEACDAAAQAAKMQPRAAGIEITTLCVPGE